MRVLKIVVPVLIGLALVAFLAGPIGPMPGVFIGGTSTAAPDQWGEASEVDQIKLRVPGTVPRVVIVWVVEHAGELHVVGSKDSGWVQMIGSGSPVEVRIGDRTYTLQASPIAEGWDDVLAAYVAKYEADYPDLVASFPPIEEAVDIVAVFRLDRT